MFSLFLSLLVLGLTYSFELDLWSLAVTLYELFTGRIMFAGHTNNQMLRLFMALKGPFPHRLIRNAMFRDRHFDSQFNFLYHEIDKVTHNVRAALQYCTMYIIHSSIVCNLLLDIKIWHLGTAGESNCADEHPTDT